MPPVILLRQSNEFFAHDKKCDCVAAAAQLLPEDRPGKVGGPPGDAFELIYAGVTDKVREKLHSVDPVLGEYIRFAIPTLTHFLLCPRMQQSVALAQSTSFY